MNKYFKSLIYIFAFIIFLSLIMTLFNYFNIINGIFLTIFKVFIPIISLFIGGFIMGKNSINKGWLNGIEIGLIVSILFLLLSLIFKCKLNWFSILYYLVLIIVSTLGGMFGISKGRIND